MLTPQRLQPKDNPPIRLIYEYKGKKYVIEKLTGITFVNWDNELNDWNWFWYTDGNGACACNQSLDIKEKYPDFPGLTCGNTFLKLIDYYVI